jgi:hypothetical protein
MSDLPRETERLFARRPHSSWAMAIVTAVLVLLIAGVLPRAFW